MKFKFEQHCSDASLERYVLGNLPAEDLDCLDEHLLICEPCREKLDATERYVRAMRSAAMHLRGERASAADTRGGFVESVREWFARPMRAWATAAAAFCLLAFVTFSQILHPLVTAAPVAVALVAERGASVSAPAHRVLDLTLDARGFETARETRVELVDSGGKTLAAQPAQATGDHIRFRVARNLDAGSYYVRVYGSAGLEREFALDLR
jgi:anti-sigma factor RsiW